MQNIVEVACSSPPITMNATKPTAQTVQATDQDPFDLVLQKASERIDNKQCDSAAKSSDSRSTDKSRGSESKSSQKVAEPKSEREVDTSKKSEKENNDDLENDDDAVKKNETTDYSQPVIAYVPTAAEKPLQVIETEAVQEEIFSGDVTANAIVNTQSAANELDVKTGKEGNASLSTAMTTDQEAVIDTPIDDLAEIFNKGAKIGEETKTDLKMANDIPNDKKVDAGMINVSAATNGLGQEVLAVENKGQVVSSPLESLKSKADTIVDSTPETAPPDTPKDGMTGLATGSVVQTTQISEPARLAEAPKNEVINQVANQIDQMVKTGRSSLHLQLYPEELGHIDLRIVTTKDGINVTMMTDKASTQQVLKSEMDLLRQNIEQAGIQLSNLNINQGQNSNKQQSFEHRQNIANNSYPETGDETSNSAKNEPRVHLTSSLVDFRV